MAIFWRLAVERASAASIRPAGGTGTAGDDGGIAPFHGMRGELPRQEFMRRIGLGDDQQPRCILVDAMDDPRPRDAADARQPPGAMVEQRIDHRAIVIARRRMDDQPRRLVDDQQRVIFMNDGQRNILRHAFRTARGSGMTSVSASPPFTFERRVPQHAAGARHAAAADQRLQPFAAVLRQRQRQRTIEPQPRRMAGNTRSIDFSAPITYPMSA